jgi:hypothetical protein
LLVPPNRELDTFCLQRFSRFALTLFFFLSLDCFPCCLPCLPCRFPCCFPNPVSTSQSNAPLPPLPLPLPPSNRLADPATNDIELPLCSSRAGGVFPFFIRPLSDSSRRFLRLSCTYATPTTLKQTTPKTAPPMPRVKSSSPRKPP